MSAARTMSQPRSEWRCMTSYSASVSFAGLLRIASGTPILPTSWSRPASRMRPSRSEREAELGRDRGRELRDGLAVAARVGVLRVDRAGQRARERARVVLVLGDGVAGGQLEVGPVDRDVLVHALGAEEREVGLADEVVPATEAEGLGDPGGRRERWAVRAVAGERADALGELHRAERAGAGQDDRELVAPDPVAGVGGALGRADRLAERLEALVAGLVAVGLVDRLELVDVHEHERDRLAGPPAALELASEVLLEGAVVAQARERVAHRDLREALDLGAAGVLEPAAEAKQHAREPDEQGEAGGEGERRGGQRRALDAAQPARVGEAGRGRAV